MVRHLRLIPVLLLLLLAAPRALAAGPNDACDYITGFMMLANGFPQVVGSCTDQGHYLDPGADPHDFVQHTTNGILVRRTFNLEPEFTNGYQTWVVNPEGQTLMRLNTEQFDWEKVPHVVAPGIQTNTAVLPCVARDMNYAHCVPASSLPSFPTPL
jgi:hypothetical protein